MADDTDKDKAYDPDKDPEAEFMVEDQEMDDETHLRWKNMCTQLILMRLVITSWP